MRKPIGLRNRNLDGCGHRRDRRFDSLPQRGRCGDGRLESETAAHGHMHRKLPSAADAPNQMCVDLGRRLRRQFSIGIASEQIDENLVLILTRRALGGVLR